MSSQYLRNLLGLFVFSSQNVIYTAISLNKMSILFEYIYYLELIMANLYSCLEKIYVPLNA